MSYYFCAAKSKDQFNKSSTFYPIAPFCNKEGYHSFVIAKDKEYNLENNKIPVLTTKKVAIKTCIKELLWFISGSTDNKILKSPHFSIECSKIFNINI